jgi:replication factor C subunit 1
VALTLLSSFWLILETTTATLVSKEAGRDLLEFNASDARSKKTLQQTLGSSIDSQSLAFSRKGNAPSKQKVIIMDEVDGMGAGDRSGMAELIQIIKKSKTPIICICNDRQSQKIKSLLPYCMDLRFSRPTKTVLANRVIRIAAQEGLTVERNAAEAIAESCGNDVRQVLNLLQMWSQKRDGNNAVTYKGLKDREKTIQKDEILRVSLFDAAKVILEGRRDLSNADGKANVASLMKRSDAFFVDYSFTGLIVQQNYPKILNGQFLRAKQSGNPNVELAMLEQMHLAAESMSDYNLVESEIRGGDGNWGLLPASAIMAVKCGYHAGGEDGGFMPGFPEFTAWMGKNSTMGKNYRLLNELHHHMNYHVSANSQELRQTYVPVIRDRIFRLLKEDDNSAATEEAIQLMDDYGLSREDIAERLEAFVLGKPDHTFDDLDSKQKAAFTRAYNAGKHMSQALVSEQGAGPKKKKSGGSKKDPLDLDVIDEDGDDDDDDDDDDEEDDEKDMEKLRKQFKSKGRKPKAQTAVSKKQKKNNKK